MHDGNALQHNVSIQGFDSMEFIPATVSLTIYDSGQIRIPYQLFLIAIEKDEISPNIKQTFMLNEIVAAHYLMESGSGGGKIVIVL